MWVSKDCGVCVFQRLVGCVWVSKACRVRVCVYRRLVGCVVSKNCRACVCVECGVEGL